jgi:hypothetical protein
VCYVIEANIPLPASHRGTPKPFGPKCALSEAMWTLQVGESFLVETQAEFIRARGLVTGLKPKRFSMHKFPHEGWRIWRTE